MILTAVTGAALACGGRAPRAGPAAPLAAWCVPDTARLEAVTLGSVRMLASGRDSLFAAMRDSLARMPYVPATQVVRVTDERLCERASRALAAQLFDPPRFEPVRLFRAGPRYVAVPRDARMGEFGYAVHLDASTFRKLAVTTF